MHVKAVRFMVYMASLAEHNALLGLCASRLGGGGRTRPLYSSPGPANPPAYRSRRFRRTFVAGLAAMHAARRRLGLNDDDAPNGLVECIGSWTPGVLLTAGRCIGVGPPSTHPSAHQ